jgi:hypothetical protein
VQAVAMTREKLVGKVLILEAVRLLVLVKELVK